MAGIISSVLQSGLPEHQDSTQYRAGRFHNLVAPPARSVWEEVGIWRDFLFGKPAGTLPDRAIPVQAMTLADVMAAPDFSV
ncbi:hypothetical protein, partial [Vibrio diabolicus]